MSRAIEISMHFSVRERHSHTTCSRGFFRKVTPNVYRTVEEYTFFEALEIKCKMKKEIFLKEGLWHLYRFLKHKIAKTSILQIAMESMRVRKCFFDIIIQLLTSRHVIFLIIILRWVDERKYFNASILVFEKTDCTITF